MKISKQNRRNAKQLFQSCLVNGVLDENRARQVVTEVAAAKPRGFVALLEHFKHLVELDEARRSATIESAVALTPELETSFKSALSKRYGAGLRFTFAPNASLIGGVRVQVDSDVYDSTVLARLNALKETF